MKQPTEAEKRLIANYMRQLIRPPHVTTALMRRDLLDWIEGGDLLEVKRWPGHHIILTPAGRDFLSEIED